MSNDNLFHNEVYLNKYGRLLRSSSFDELPELINIFVGDMSIVRCIIDIGVSSETEYNFAVEK